MQNVISVLFFLIAVGAWTAFIITRDRSFLDTVWFCMGGGLVTALWAIYNELRGRHP